MHILASKDGIGNMCLFWCQQLGQVTKSERLESIITNPVFFLEKEIVTHNLTFIFLTVHDGYLQRYMVCLSEFVVKSAVTKYAVKNYISKSMMVSGLICHILENRVCFGVKSKFLRK